MRWLRYPGMWLTRDCGAKAPTAPLCAGFRDVRLPPRGLSICLVVRWRKRPAQRAGDRRQEADRFGLHVNVTSSSFFLATSSICFPPFSATTGILVGGQPHGEADGVRKLHLKVSSQIIVGKAFSLDPSPET
jgi:hypothetical protein